MLRCDGAVYTQFYGWCVFMCVGCRILANNTKRSDQSMRMKTRITQVKLSMFGRSVGQTLARSFDMLVCMQTWFDFRARPAHTHTHTNTSGTVRNIVGMSKQERKRNKQKAHNNIISLMIYVIPLEGQAKTIVSSHSAKL